MVNNVDDMTVVHKKMESLGPVHQRNRCSPYQQMGPRIQQLLFRRCTAQEDRARRNRESKSAYPLQAPTRRLFVVCVVS
jgi:hypothetical protein